MSESSEVGDDSPWYYVLKHIESCRCETEFEHLSCQLHADVEPIARKLNVIQAILAVLSIELSAMGLVAWLWWVLR